jgi:hypothetical protein
VNGDEDEMSESDEFLSAIIVKIHTNGKLFDVKLENNSNGKELMKEVTSEMIQVCADSSFRVGSRVEGNLGRREKYYFGIIRKIHRNGTF